MSPNTAALPRTKPASAGISHRTCRSQGNKEILRSRVSGAATLPRRLNFVRRCLIPVGIQYGTCCMSAVKRLDSYGGSYMSVKLVHPFNNCPTRCDLFSLLHFCRQLYMLGHPFNNCPTRCDLFSLLHFCRQLYMLVHPFNNCPTRCDLFSLLHFCMHLCIFRELTPIIRSSYNCNYSFWY